MLAVFGQFVFPALLGFVAFFCIITCIHYATILARTFLERSVKSPTGTDTQRAGHLQDIPAGHAH